MPAEVVSTCPVSIAFMLGVGLLIASLSFVYLARKFNVVLIAMDDMSKHNHLLIAAKDELQNELRISRMQEISLQKALQDYKLAIPSYTDREIAENMSEDEYAMYMGIQRVS